METIYFLYTIILCLCAGILFSRDMQSLYNHFLSKCENTKAEPSLQFVFSIYRHGVRSPVFSSFPTDPYKDQVKFFPDGKGALTKAGKQLMYRVGQVVRKRYSNFINPDFSDEVRFVSTNIERTMMSAMLVSCGMFSPKGHQKWSKDIDWQPIPIWLDNNQSDKSLLWDDSTMCPKFKKDANEVKTKAKQPDKTPEHDFYEYISEKTGDRRDSIYDMFELWDILECEMLSGYTLPEWTKEIYPEKIREIIEEAFNLMVNGTSSMLNIISGPLYYRVYELLRSKLDGSLTSGRKMYLHAGHDVSVLAFLRALGYEPLLIVKPGDGVFLELHYSSGVYYVKLFYLSLLTAGEVFREIAIPGCPAPCPLSTFLSLATPLSSDQWLAECSS